MVDISRRSTSNYERSKYERTLLRDEMRCLDAFNDLRVCCSLLSVDIWPSFY